MNNKVIFVFCLVMLFSNCRPIENQVELTGDWVSIDGKHVFSFREGKGSYLFPYLNFSDFEIRNDTIIFNGKEYIHRRSHTKMEDLIFQILHCSHDKLILKNLTNNSYKVDEISLERVLPKIDKDIVGFAFHAFNKAISPREIYLEVDILDQRCNITTEPDTWSMISRWKKMKYHIFINII